MTKNQAPAFVRRSSLGDPLPPEPRQDPGPTPETAGEVLARLERVERTSGRSGAIPRTPKQQMLSPDRGLIERYEKEGKHLRWINIGNTDKATNAVLMGYESVTDEKGDHITRGNLRLMACPRDEFEERQAERRALTRAQMGYDDDGRRRDSAEFYREVEGLTNMLRQQYGHSRSSTDRIVKDNTENMGG